jgi:hypothetical protein
LIAASTQKEEETQTRNKTTETTDQKRKKEQDVPTANSYKHSNSEVFHQSIHTIANIQNYHDSVSHKPCRSCHWS